MKEFGITKQMLIDQAEKMGMNPVVNKKGQIIDQENFNKALFKLMEDRYKGGMALQAKTFKGMVSNAKDVMGTIAREMSKPIFEKFKDGLRSILPVANALVSFVRGDLAGSSKQLREAFGPKLGNQIFNAFEIVKKGANMAKDAFFDMQPTLMNLWGIFKDIAPIVGVVLAGAFKTLVTVIPPLVNGLTGIVKAITGWEGFIPVVTGLVSAFVTYKAIMLAIALQQAKVNAITKISIALSKAQRAAHLAMVISGGGLKGVLLATRAAMSALNITMLANPFVLIGALIVGLGAAFVVAYKKSDAFRKFVDGLWASMKKFGSYIATAFMTDVGELKELFARISAQWKKDWADVQKGITALKNKFNSDFNDIKTAVSVVIDWFSTTLPNLVVNFGKWFNSIDQNARNSISNMRKAVVGYIVGLVLDAVKKLTEMDQKARKAVSNMKDGIKNHINNMKKSSVDLIKSMVSSSVNWLTSLYNNGKRIINNLKTMFSNSLKIIKGIFTGDFKLIKQGVTGNLNLAYSSVRNILSKMGINVDGSVRKIKNFFVNGWNSIKSRTSEIFSSIYTTISRKIGDIVTSARNMPGRVGSAIRNMASRATSAMTSMGSSMKTKLTEKINDIKDAAAGIPGKIGSAITNKVKDATGAMKDLASSLVKKFKSALGINSPSRVFFDMAGWIIKGLVNGLSAGNLKDLGSSAFKDFAGGAFDTLSNIKSWVSGGFELGNVGGNVSSWMKQAMALTKTPLSWLQPLTTMAMKESGGKTGPSTINKWDSNWKAGIPSMGLTKWPLISAMI
ncbi:hypothetical protein ABKP09_19850 [Peribacillus frigoritolerans]|uniref:hypothetical protein n=1 Tax=Peribacillus frigoritolerans TaxID=450367 RepID=UPI0032B62265